METSSSTAAPRHEEKTEEPRGEEGGRGELTTPPSPSRDPPINLDDLEPDELYVIKRNGQPERVHFDKISKRIRDLAKGLTGVDPALIAQKTVAGISAGVTTSALDHLASEMAAYRSSSHPHYDDLASRIEVSNLHKETRPTFSAAMELAYSNLAPKTFKPSPLVTERFIQFVRRHHQRLDAMIVHERDYLFSYFGIRTLLHKYLLRARHSKMGNNDPVERPQYMMMRVALGILIPSERELESSGRPLDWEPNEEWWAHLELTYSMESLQWYTHASPTLFNAGSPNPCLASCFLLTMQDDSLRGIYETLTQCAMISKGAGGIGLNVHKIRSKDSYIHSTHGNANGLVPMLKVYDDTAKYVDQGGSKRPGAFAIYLEPWHADILDFLDLKRNHGNMEFRARNLFYGLWIPDEFMRRVIADESWSLFCPDECPGLSDVWGDEFVYLYTRYEREGMARRTMKAQELWFHILEVQIETGNPYMLFKDTANARSNQQNLGTIKCSNLCTEIIEYSSPEEIAVCNLASIALTRMVREVGQACPLDLSRIPALTRYLNPTFEEPPPLFHPIQKVSRFFDHHALYWVVRVATRNLNQVINVTHYPMPQCEVSNLRHRPIGLGVQGLADTFLKLFLPFEGAQAQQLNREIFETIYFAALCESTEQARQWGPYASYSGSPASKGLLHMDLCAQDARGPEFQDSEALKLSGRWNWDLLRQDIRQQGLRNSLLVAPMPTATTSQILGNNECFEPMTSNMYTRRVLAGEFYVVNRYLVEDLQKLGLWNPSLKNEIVGSRGSVQGLDQVLPSDLREVYRTVWEIKQRHLITMARDRGHFVDQSQSFNVHLADPTFEKLTSLHVAAWQQGLKTGLYYLRSLPKSNPIAITVDQENRMVSEESATATKAPKRPAPSTAFEDLPASKRPAFSSFSSTDQICTREPGCASCSC